MLSKTLFYYWQLFYFCQAFFNIFPTNSKKLRLTFWLYATFQPAYKATRRVAAGWNVGEGAAGGAADLGD
jgi:hypothetical protein